MVPPLQSLPHPLVGLAGGGGALRFFEGDRQLVGAGLLGCCQHRSLAVVSLHLHLARAFQNASADEIHIASHHS